jgi:hypothetical protein
LLFQVSWERELGDSTGSNLDHKGPAYLLCSFCGKSQIHVEKLIAGPGGVYICNECVKLCAEVIAEEREQAQRSDRGDP